MRKNRKKGLWKRTTAVLLAGILLCGEGGVAGLGKRNMQSLVYAEESSTTVITSLEYYDASNGAVYEKSGVTDASFGFVMPKFNGKDSSELALPAVESDLELQVSVNGEWKNINDVEYFKFNSTWGWEYQDWGGWICWFKVQETTRLRFHGKTNDVNLEYTLNFTKLESASLTSIAATVAQKDADATGGAAIGWETIRFNNGVNTYDQIKEDMEILVKREDEDDFVSLLDNAESGWIYDQNFGIYTDGNGGIWFSGVEKTFTVRLQSKSNTEIYADIQSHFETPERSGATLTPLDGNTVFDAKDSENHKASIGICLPKIAGTYTVKSDLELFVYEVCVGAVYDSATGTWSGGEWKTLSDVEASGWVYQANGYNSNSARQQWGYWVDSVYGLWFQPVKNDMYLRIGYPENGQKGGSIGDNYVYYTFLGDEEAVIPDVSDMTDIEVDMSEEEPAGDVTEVPELEGWSLIFHDEFNGTALDETKWSHQTGYLLDENDIDTFGWGNNELEHYTDSDQNSSVADGKLKITMLKDPKTFTASNGSVTASYSSAKLISKNKFAVKYGRVDFRAKLPAGDGVWPALWMMPNDDVYGGWASSGEIDIFEGRGRTPEIAFGTLHYGGAWPANTSTGSTMDMTAEGNKKSDMTDWHVYSLVWEEGNIKIYADGKCFFKCTSDTWYSSNAAGNENAPFDQQFYLIMNLAAGGWFDNNVQPDYDTFTSKEMYVDYVRVYQKPTDSEILDENSDGLYGTYLNNSAVETVAVERISLDKENLTLEEGENEMLVHTIFPSNAENKEVTWISSDPEVVAVSENGELTAGKEGTATITVITKDGAHEASCVIVVKSNAVTTEVVTTEELTTEVTTEKETTEEITTEVTTEKVTTEERTTEQVTTEATTEETTEKVTTEERTTEQVTTEATTEKVTTEEVTTEQTTTEATTEKVTTEELTTEQVTTEATTEKVTTEEQTTEQATTEVTTETQGVKVQRIQIEGISKKIAAGKKVQLTATCNPVNVANTEVVWTSSNTRYATVNQKGMVTTKKAGKNKTVIITATAADGSNVKATYKIKIMPKAVSKIVLKAATKTVKAGKKLKIKAIVTPSKKVNKTLSWKSSNTKYATVNAQGLVKTKKAGKGKTVKITAIATDGSNTKKTMKIKIK